MHTFFTRYGIKSLIFFLMYIGGKEVFFKEFDKVARCLPRKQMVAVEMVKH